MQILTITPRRHSRPDHVPHDIERHAQQHRRDEARAVEEVHLAEIERIVLGEHGRHQWPHPGHVEVLRARLDQPR